MSETATNPQPPASPPFPGAGAGLLPWLEKNWVIGLGLATLTALVYLRMLGQQFVNFDDPVFIIDNPHVSSGLTWEGLRWAFGLNPYSQWHPLTWISHQLDCELFGLNPAGHKAHNLLLHAANTWLVFEALRRYTGARWRSAAVAALFALHPIHVEAVAWIAERKELLMVFFGLLTLLEYLRYTRRPGVGRYALVSALFALTLMAKPTLVTLPFVMLLLDFWPLGRGETLRTTQGRARGLRLLAEKLPLLALGVVAGYLSWLCQVEANAVASLGEVPLRARVEGSFVAYAWYLHKTFLPTGFALQHTYPIWYSLGRVLLSVAIVLAVTAFAIWSVRRRPYAFVGWFLFLGTLVPVIGLVRVGGQAYAERYTYFPLLGVFIVLVWAVDELVRRFRVGREIVVSVAAIACLLLMLLTVKQVGYWKDSLTVWRRALAVDYTNPFAHNNLAVEHLARGELDGAAHHAAASLRSRPSAEALRNLASVAWLRRNFADAEMYFGEAMKLQPGRASDRTNIGNAILAQDRPAEAEAHFREAIRLDPAAADARRGLGISLGAQRRFAEAIPELRQSLQANPNDKIVRDFLVSALVREGRVDEAIAITEAWVRAHPEDGEARVTLEQLRRGPESQPATQPATQTAPAPATIPTEP